MTDSGEIQTPIDGRAARRERNIDMVLDVVLEMFAEESLFPTIEQDRETVRAVVALAVSVFR